MQASNIPTKFPIPWGNGAGSGYIRTIPTASQIAIQAGAASLTDGFPPATFTPTGSGGTPPFGQDFNGIHNQETAWLRWYAAGGPIPYDSTFQTAIGGYPNGAIIASVASPGTFWLSTADNNTSDPDTGGPNWTPFAPAAATPIIYQTYTAGTYSWTCPANVYRIEVTVTGGGGGGAGAASSGQGGGCGGAGGTVVSTVAVTPGQSYAIVVGGGGAGGAAGANPGIAGVASTAFGLSAGGGGFGNNTGVAGGVSGGSGGAVSGGQINLPGGSGSDGFIGSISGFSSWPGLGGNSFYGGGGKSAESPGAAGQSNGTAGAGGGSGYGTSISGGAGGSGFVVIKA